MDTPTAAAQLRSYVERVLRLREEITALNADVSEVYKEAVGNGFDKKTLQATVKRAGQDIEAVQEQDALLELYWSAWTGTDGAIARAPARPAEPTPHDPDTGEVIETANTNTSAPSQAATGGSGSEQSSDAVPAADVGESPTPGQSERAPDPTPAAKAPLEMPPIPDILRRTRATG